MEENKYVELYELQKEIADRIGLLEQWVKVEIESHRVSGGHHYLNFIQKGADGRIIAKATGRIWRSHEDIVTFFRMMTGEELKAGMTVVVLACVEYHPAYGLNLTIEDIDPQFTLGQRELEKRMTIEKLEKEGMMERQQRLSLPFLPGKVAVISSADAAGYGDFTRQLEKNQHGFVFDITLFHSVMQGEKSPASIISSLEKIARDGSYELVLILRGGGADSDMFAYDDYALCRAIALCPIPVMTAVGHERDYHVADMVANRYFKTPTAIAEALILWVEEVESEVDRCLENIRFALNGTISAMDNQVSLLEASIKAADPRNILRQGYVLATDSDGIIIKSAAKASQGDKFSLRFSDGRWDCTIDKTRTENDK
ncbi:MAG: exodeoxyribonuclease VII large subunit [Bacteroidales bacterium]|nr:exodeoxyribonuclease VII large subunit [Bacteroidales bacterium]